MKRTGFPLFDPRCRFTDDTVLTLAVADAIVSGEDYGAKLRQWYALYPGRGYGSGFRAWAALERPAQGDSMGNGSAMRVSPVGFAFDTVERAVDEARLSAEPSHSHPEGIKGAQAVASAVFLARTSASKADIKRYVEESFGYDLTKTLDQIRPHYHFDATCPGSVPEAITAFLESDGYEDAVRKAVSLGGDSDTIACIAGGIAEAYYGVPADIRERVLGMLDAGQKDVLRRFSEYCRRNA